MKINFWEIPLICDFLAILSIVLPFWSRVDMGYLTSVWSWGLMVDTNYASFQIGFMNNTIFLITGLFFTFLEVMAINILSIITYRIWKNDIDVFNVRIFSFITMIILILSPIFIVIGSYVAIIEWSEFYIPTLGFVFPFIGAFFALATIVLAKKYVKK